MKKPKTSTVVFYRVDFFSTYSGTWLETHASPFNTLAEAKDCFKTHPVARITRVTQTITTAEKEIEVYADKPKATRDRLVRRG